MHSTSPSGTRIVLHSARKAFDLQQSRSESRGCRLGGNTYQNLFVTRTYPRSYWRTRPCVHTSTYRNLSLKQSYSTSKIPTNLHYSHPNANHNHNHYQRRKIWSPAIVDIYNNLCPSNGSCSTNSNRIQCGLQP